VQQLMLLVMPPPMPPQTLPLLLVTQLIPLPKL